MKRILGGTAAALAVGVALAPTLAMGGQPKITLCHATGSADNPYALVTVATPAAAHAHAKHHHGGDILPQFTYKGTSYGSAEGSLFVANGCQAPDDGGDTGGDGGGGSF